jgi:uncharacterized protein
VFVASNNRRARQASFGMIRKKLKGRSGGQPPVRVFYRFTHVQPGAHMTQIVVEHNPSEEKLKQLGVSGWSIWEKEVSRFPLDFDMTESAYLLEGEIHVTPQGGEKVVIKAGDFVVFPKGMKSMWEVVKPLRKHYQHS